MDLPEIALGMEEGKIYQQEEGTRGGDGNKMKLARREFGKDTA